LVEPETKAEAALMDLLPEKKVDDERRTALSIEVDG
jgi:hypothetical protein